MAIALSLNTDTMIFQPPTRQPNSRRHFITTVAAVVGAAQVPRAFAQGSDLLFAVNEGVSYRFNPIEAQERYKPVADELGRVLKHPVRAVAIGSYKELQAGLAERKYALAMVHPAHHAIRAMVHSGYPLAAVAKGFTDYKASFFVMQDSAVKALADLRGKSLVAPDEDSITSVMMRATLRDANLAQEIKQTYVRYQDAVPFSVENGLLAAGVSASKGVLKAGQAKGGRVVASSQAVPIKQLIVSGASPAGTLERVAEFFLALDGSNKTTAPLLEATRLTGFQAFDEAALKAQAGWHGVA